MSKNKNKDGTYNAWVLGGGKRYWERPKGYNRLSTGGGVIIKPIQDSCK